MSKRSLFLFSFVFVVLGLVDLVTTVQGFALGFVEGDGVFVPFGFVLVGFVCLGVSELLVRKGVVKGFVAWVVGVWYSLFMCIPVVGNLLLIGGVV